MADKIRILILEDVKADYELLIREMKRSGIDFESRCVSTRDGFLAELAGFRPDVVISDYKLPSFDGMEALAVVKERAPGVPVIISTGTINEETAVECMKAGAVDYVLKDRMKKIGQSVLKAVAAARLKQEKIDVDATLEAAHGRLSALFYASPLAIIAIDMDSNVTEWNPAAERMFGWTAAEMIGRCLPPVPDGFQDEFDRIMNDALKGKQTINLETVRRNKNGALVDVLLSTSLIRDAAGAVTGMLGVFTDISERRRAEKALRGIAWLLKPGSLPAAQNERVYGDLTRFNTSRVILDAVGSEQLADIANDFITLLETSLAIYEKNGDYAFGIFASGWCRMIDEASFRACREDNPAKALASRRWRCHESCWKDAAKAAIDAAAPVDIACAGGIRLYAVPIFAGGEVIGAIDFGYGDPPKDEAALRELAGAFRLPVEALRKAAGEYQTRPTFVIDIAKQRIAAAARLIGAMVEKARAAAALAASEDRYKHVTQVIADFAYSCVHDGERYRIEWMTGAFYELSGYTEAELREKGCWMRFAHPADADLAADRLKGLAAGGEIVFELRLLTKAGDTIWLSNHMRCVADPGAAGGLRLYGAAQDITERKLAEQRLTEINGTLRAVMDPCPLPILPLGFDGTVTVWNRAAEKTFGWSADEVVGRGLPYIPPDLDDEVREKIAQMRAGRDIGSYETVRRTRDGRRLNVVMRTALLHDVGGAITGFLAIIEDVTEIRKTELALRESEKQYRHLYETMQDSFVAVDMEGRITACNGAYLSLTGYARDELFRMTYLELTPAGWLAAEQEIVRRQIIPRGYSDLYEKEYIRKDGTVVPVELRTVLEKDAEGRPVFMWAVIRDISDRKRAEGALRESEHKFRELFENIRSGVAVYEAVDGGADFVFKDINKTVMRIEGVRKEEVGGRKLSEAFPGVKEMGLVELIRQVWRSGRPEFLPATRYRDRKRTGWRENYIFRLPSGLIVVVYDDVTVQKENEESLRQAYEDLKSAQLQLLQSSKMAAVGVLAAGVGGDRGPAGDAGDPRGHAEPYPGDLRRG